MLTAMRAVDNLLDGAHHDIWEVNAESVYHETHVADEHPYRAAPRRPRCRRSKPRTLTSAKRLLLPGATVAAGVLLVAVSLQTVWWSPLNVDEELTLRVADFSFGNVFHIVSTQARRRPAALLARALPAGLVAGPRLAAPPVDRLRVPRPAGRRADRTRADRRRGRRRRRAADRGRADPGALRDVRPAAHAALRVAAVGDRARAARRAARAAGAGGSPPGRARALGLRASDRAAVRDHGLCRGCRLRAAAAARGAARSMAGRGRAACSPSCRTTCARCTCSTIATASAAAKPAGRTFTGRPVWEDALHFVAPGRHDLNYFTRARARSASTHSSSRAAVACSRSARSRLRRPSCSSPSSRRTATRRSSSTAT